MAQMNADGSAPGPAPINFKVPFCSSLRQTGTNWNLDRCQAGPSPIRAIRAIRGSFPAGRAGVGPGAFKVQGSKFKVQGSRFKVQGSRFKVQGSRFKVQGSKFKVQGSTVQRFNGSTVQRFNGSGVQRPPVFPSSRLPCSTVQGSRFKVQRFKVQRFKVQRFNVQAFKGPLSSRLPCSKVVTGCNSVVSVVSCEFS